MNQAIFAGLRLRNREICQRKEGKGDDEGDEGWRQTGTFFIFESTDMSGADAQTDLRGFSVAVSHLGVAFINGVCDGLHKVMPHAALRVRVP